MLPWWKDFKHFQGSLKAELQRMVRGANHDYDYPTVVLRLPLARLPRQRGGQPRADSVCTDYIDSASASPGGFGRKALILGLFAVFGT